MNPSDLACSFKNTGKINNAPFSEKVTKIFEKFWNIDADCRLLVMRICPVITESKKLPFLLIVRSFPPPSREDMDFLSSSRLKKGGAHPL